MVDIIITVGIAVLLCGLLSKIHEKAKSRRVQREYKQYIDGLSPELRNNREEAEELYRTGGISVDEYMNRLNRIYLDSLG